MLDIAAFAESLLTRPASHTKEASAPAINGREGEHSYSVLLRKVAHAIRTQGVTVSEMSLDDVLDGTAQLKIAMDEASPVGSAISRSKIAAEARELATMLRKHAADVRRASVARIESELEREVIAAHEKRANEGYMQGHGQPGNPVVTPPPEAPSRVPRYVGLAGLGLGAYAGHEALQDALAAQHGGNNWASHLAANAQPQHTTSINGVITGIEPVPPNSSPWPAIPQGVLRTTDFKPKGLDVDAEKMLGQLQHYGEGAARSFGGAAQSALERGQEAVGAGADYLRSLFAD